MLSDDVSLMCAYYVRGTCCTSKGARNAASLSIDRVDVQSTATQLCSGLSAVQRFGPTQLTCQFTLSSELPAVSQK